MSHDYGRRDSCAAGGVTALTVGSGALLGFSGVELSIIADRYSEALDLIARRWRKIRDVHFAT